MNHLVTEGIYKHAEILMSKIKNQKKKKYINNISKETISIGTMLILIL